jgi:hypothetical protein
MSTRAKWWLVAGAVAILALASTIYVVVHDLHERERLMDPLPRYPAAERNRPDRPPVTDAGM